MDRPTSIFADAELPLAQLSLDINADGRFAAGELQLHTRHWRWRAGPESDWAAIERQSTHRLKERDHGGVATLDLMDGDTLLQRWHCTLAQHTELRALLRVFEHGHAQSDDDLPDPEVETPPSTWVLLRL